MKVLMIGQHVNFFRNLDSVMRELCRRGHEVVFLHGTRSTMRACVRRSRRTTKKRLLGRGLQVAQSEIAGVTSGYRPEPARAVAAVVFVSAVRSSTAGSTFARDHPSPERVVAGIEKDLPDDLSEEDAHGRCGGAPSARARP